MENQDTHPDDELASLLAKGYNAYHNTNLNQTKTSKIIAAATTFLLALAILIVIYLLRFSNLQPKQTQLPELNSFIQKRSSLVIKSEDHIIKPEIDNRDYRFIELQNTMKVMLISDPTSLQSSAAVYVQVGSYADPKYMQGLAHFCEHMLFVSSEKYPEVDGLQKFLSNYNGDTNAFTQTEDTNYYFEVTAGGFEPSLDRFSNMFISPIFKEDQMRHEVASIDGELNRNLNDDGWRLKFLRQITSNPESVLSNFDIGSANSLMNTPQKKGIDVVKELQDFWKRHYSSNLMTMVVTNNKPLDEIETSVKNTFSKVPNTHKEAPSYANDPWPFTGKYANKLVQYIPSSPIRSLQLVFQVGSSQKHPYLDPYSFLTVLLLAKGKGSLIDLLMKEGLVSDLDAGRTDTGSAFEIFMIDLNLSDEGFKNMEKVAKIVFGFLDLVAKEGINADLYQQYSHINNYTFHYIASEEDTLTRLSNIASNLHSYPPKYGLSGDRVVNGFDETLLKQYISYFNPDNLMIFLRNPDFKISKDPKDTFNHEFIQLSSSYEKENLRFAGHNNGRLHNHKDKKDKITLKELDLQHSLFGISYGISDLPKDLLKELGEVSHKDYPELRLSDISQYTPKSFKLAEKPCSLSKVQCIQDYQGDATQKKPLEILQDDYITVWHQLDRSKMTPMIIGDIIFHSPEVQTDVAIATAAHLKTELINLQLEQKLQEITLAGNKVQIGPSVVQIEAFSDVFPEVMTSVLKKFKYFDFNEEQFESARTSLVSKIYSTLSTDTYKNLLRYQAKLLLEHYFLDIEIYEQTKAISFSDLKTYLKNLYSPLYTEALFLGNILDSQAKDFGQNIVKMFDYEPLKEKKPIENRVLNITGQNLVFRTSNPVDGGKQNLILNTYQDGIMTAQRLSYLNLLTKLANSEAYEYLRTEQQICYLVQAFADKTNNVLGLNILVESHSMEPNEIDGHIEIALKRVEKKIQDLSQQDFNVLVKALEESLKDDALTLHDKGEVYFSHILNQDYLFDLKDRLLNYLPKLTKGGFLDYFRNLVMTPRKLSVQFYPEEHDKIPIETLPKEKQLSNTDAVLITDAAMLEKLNRFPTSLKMNDE